MIDGGKALRYYHLPYNSEIINNKLLFIIGQIGHLYKDDFPKSKESVVKKGVRKIYSELKGQDIFLTKRQIKLLIKPKQKKITLKIPTNSVKTFNLVLKLLHKDEYLLENCQKYCFVCLNMDGCLCRDNLIGPLYNLMRFNSESENIYAQQNYIELLKLKTKCNKKCE